MNGELVMTVFTFWFLVVPSAGLIGFFIGILFVSIIQALQDRFSKRSWYPGYSRSCDLCKHSRGAQVQGACEHGLSRRYIKCHEAG